MSELSRATDTPDKILTGYGTVRSAELKVIDEFLVEDISLSGVTKRFGRPNSSSTSGYESSHIEDCIKFMHSLDLIDRSAQDVVKPLNRDIYPELSFEARLLHHIRSQHGDEYQLAEIHDLLMEHTSTDKEHGFRRVDEEALVELLKKESKFDIQWRTEKTSMWANLLDPIGAISYSTDHDEIVTSPTRALLHELLTYHQTHRDDPEGILQALEWIHEEFVPVFHDLSGVPRLHVGVADTLDNMTDDGSLDFVGMTDVTQTVRLPYRIDDTEEPARYKIGDAPDRPAYWHPLERSERRIEQ